MRNSPPLSFMNVDPLRSFEPVNSVNDRMCVLTYIINLIEDNRILSYLYSDSKIKCCNRLTNKNINTTVRNIHYEIFSIFLFYLSTLTIDKICLLLWYNVLLLFFDWDSGWSRLYTKGDIAWVVLQRFGHVFIEILQVVSWWCTSTLWCQKVDCFFG